MTWGDAWHLTFIVVGLLVGVAWFRQVRAVHALTQKHHYYYGLALMLLWPTWSTNRVTIVLTALIWSLALYVMIDDFMEHWIQVVSGNMLIGSPALRWYGTSWLYRVARSLHLDT